MFSNKQGVSVRSCLYSGNNNPKEIYGPEFIKIFRMVPVLGISEINPKLLKECIFFLQVSKKVEERGFQFQLNPCHKTQVFVGLKRNGGDFKCKKGIFTKPIKKVLLLTKLSLLIDSDLLIDYLTLCSYVFLTAEFSLKNHKS